MAASGLQRSTDTYRRPGSSASVWKDRPMSEDGNLAKSKEEGEESTELLASQGVGTTAQMERNRLDGGKRPYRAGGVSPVVDQPSPKVPGCGLCGLFGNSGTTKKPKPRRR